MQIVPQLLLHLLLHVEKHVAIQIAIQDFGMDVALAADGGRIAEAGRDLLDRVLQVPFGGGLGVELLELAERHRREHRPCPGAEVFSGNVASRDFLQVGVHVGRGDLLTFAILIQILKEMLARQDLGRRARSWRYADP